MVTLDIGAPRSLSSIPAPVSPSPPNVSAPVFDIRAAQSRIGVEDGKTIVIGGLMQDQKQQTISKIPILGDIPYLGMLFKRTPEHQGQNRAPHLPFTPHVALRPDALPAMSRDEEQGLKLTPNAISPGTFQDHICNMERGGSMKHPDTLPPQDSTTVPPQEPASK